MWRERGRLCCPDCPWAGREGRFVKKSGWRRLATHYGISIEMVDERLGHEHDAKVCARVRFPKQMREERDCGCPVVFARYVVRGARRRRIRRHRRCRCEGPFRSPERA